MNFFFRLSAVSIFNRVHKKLHSLHITLNLFRVQSVNMGLLTEGSPLSWEETKALAEHVRQHGVEQFINLYRKLQDRTGDVLKWGDEVCFCHNNITIARPLP